jgi:hypothetical protein
MSRLPDTTDVEPKRCITEVTRRAIMDYLSVGRHWSGALPEDDFLGRIYDLRRMPTTDYRPEYDNAAKDIWKHRVINNDWPDDWVLTDDRFDLLYGPDEPFLRFLAETVHPIVRPDTEDASAMVAEFNSLLGIDGWEIGAVREISAKPVFGYRRISDASVAHLTEVRRLADRLSGHYIAQQVRRLQESSDKDTELAIGTAKEFLETVCKTIHVARTGSVPKNDDLPNLVRSTIKILPVVPLGIEDQAQSEKTITVLLNNLGSIGQQLAEMRNQFGTGHGRSSGHIGLQKRHARLAIGAVATLAGFLYECHEAEPVKA